jgi:hypothetical protein
MIILLASYLSEKEERSMKLNCAIYSTEGIIFLGGNEDKILIPTELAAYPRVVTNVYGSRILLNEGSSDPYILDALKQHILTLLSYYKSQGLVRIDTPSFYEMLIYNSTEEAPAEPYPNIDDLINSFLCSKGAEFIV